MKTATATTFEVSDVVRAGIPLPEIPYKRAVEALLTAGPIGGDPVIAEAGARRRPSAPAPATPGAVEACTRYHGRLVDGVAYHPVVAAAHLAFMGHRPLTLSPDTIWLMICQGVANHVNAHAEELRPRFVRHKGRVEIRVRRDDFRKGSPENPWPEVFAEFSAGVRGHVGPAIDRFLPAFSTTGPVERATAEVVLLDAVQSYFSYTTYSWCGIPEVTLEGTTGDWGALAERAEGFAEYGLEGWLAILRPILGQFVRASRGDVDTEFWRSIYKHLEMSGGPAINGWVMAFFPYLKDGRTGLASDPVEFFFGEDPGPLERTLYPGRRSRGSNTYYAPTSSLLPGGLSKAPFCWEYLDKTFPMEFLGGFVGVAQDERTLALRPEIGWAVREAASPA